MNEDFADKYPCLEGIFLDSDGIARRVEDLARAICRDSAACERLVLVVILKGACVFAMDLARALNRAGLPDVRIDFIRASTYGAGMKGGAEEHRAVRIESFTGTIAGEHVLLVDDILDQGFTLSALQRHFLTEGAAASVRTAVFLAKELSAPSAAVRALRASFAVDYVGMTAPDRWLVGYGLDIGERFRELPYIAIAREECFR